MTNRAIDMPCSYLYNTLTEIIMEEKFEIDIQPKDTSRGHFYVSLVKSFLRISGFVTLYLAAVDPTLMAAWLKVTAGFLMLAECLGILEELV